MSKNERQGWIDAGSLAAAAASGLECYRVRGGARALPSGCDADFGDQLEAARLAGWEGDEAQATRWMEEGWDRYRTSFGEAERLDGMMDEREAKRAVAEYTLLSLEETDEET